MTVCEVVDRCHKLVDEPFVIEQVSQLAAKNVDQRECEVAVAFAEWRQLDEFALGGRQAERLDRVQWFLRRRLDSRQGIDDSRRFGRWVDIVPEIPKRRCCAGSEQ
jgi:hypothetical protein